MTRRDGLPPPGGPGFRLRGVAIGRRAALLAGCGPALLALSGCGFRPVYGRVGAESGTAREGLAAITVERIPERSGQLLRLALQARFERFESAAARRYLLRSNFAIEDDANAIAQDSTVTRERLVGRSEYTLLALSDRRTLTSGTARAVDGLDVINQQYFAADLTRETIVRRLADSLADQIALQLGAYFDLHGAA